MTLLGAAQIRELAAKLDLKPSKSLGQNFVRDWPRSGLINPGDVRGCTISYRS